MNIYEKLQTARLKLQAVGLQKSGKNTHTGYSYFELGDFLPKLNEIMAELQMTSVVCFEAEIATLTLVDIEKPEDTIRFLSPMSKANLKNCHDVQNLGAVQTYLRRYLYTAAFEIAEPDALNGADPPEAKTPQMQKSQPADGGQCEVCGKELTAGQVTLSTHKCGKALCPDHLNSAAPQEAQG